MLGPSVKLLPKRSGVFASGPESNREALRVVGHVKEENERGWVIAECGTFYPKETYEEVERRWDPKERED